MEKRLRLLIGSIKSTIEEINQISSLRDEAYKSGRKGDYQSHKLRVKYLKRKLDSLKKAFTNKVNGTLIIARFNLIKGEQKETYEQTFTNLSQDEVKCILELEASIHRVFLEILEIKEIPTSIRKV